MSTVQYQSIGVIHSPFKVISGMPIQPSSAGGVQGWVEVFEPFIAGLKDLEGFSHLILLYHFHRVQAFNLVVTPFLDTQPHGVFSTRAPTRPNPIGLSVVELMRIEADKLHIANVDILDGTPLLDIKPYIPAFDQQEDVRVGWLVAGEDDIRRKNSDNRFDAGSGTPDA